MTISAGVSAAKGGAATSAVTTTGVATQASGSQFIIAVEYDGGTFVSVADSKSNSYTQIGTTQTAGSSAESRFYKKENGTGGAGHTATLNISGPARGTIAFLEVLNGSVEDVAGSGRTDSASPYTTPGYTTLNTTDLLVAVVCGDSASNPATHAESTGFTIQCEETNGTSFWTICVATKVVGVGSYTASFTENGAVDTATFITGFKDPSIPPAAPGTTTTRHPWLDGEDHGGVFSDVNVKAWW